MSAYVIAQATIKDAEKLKEYGAPSPAHSSRRPGAKL
jgi:uncharacterized protein (DUF1330 family)